MVLLELNLQYIEIGLMACFLIMTGILIYEFRGMKSEIRERLGLNNETIKLKLQVLERLTLFADRSSLKNLISRVEVLPNSALGLQSILVESLRSEYDYNISQQIYVSPEIWNAVTRLKDQNTYIINQLTSNLPYDASGMDLSKLILEFSMNQEADLSGIVQDALQFEAKKILK